MASHHVRGTHRDRGDILGSWLLKLVVVLGVLAVVVLDTLSVVTTRFSTQDQGVAAARSASETWQRTGSLDAALASATSSALASNPRNRVPQHRFRVSPDGTVHLTIARTASTLLARHVPPLRPRCTVALDVTGRNTAA